ITKMAFSEQELVRREHLKQLIELGINPFPAELYPVSHLATDIKANFKDEQPEAFKEVCLAGRLMMAREAGKAMFADVQDSSGRIQIYVRRDDICPTEDKSLFDI